MEETKIPDREEIRKAYIEDFLKRKPDPKGYALFTEKQLTDFIRKYVDAGFSDVYECIDRQFYVGVRNKIAKGGEMSEADKKAAFMYSDQLKTYSYFLDSQYFTKLLKVKINIEGNDKRTGLTPSPSSHQSTAQPFRLETEGERKHITKEMDVIRRNPQFRQHCLDKYGYQCQCCGMDFASMYGENLGANFIEVHHLQPISTFETDGVPDNFVANLVPLCSNCHSMIHHLKDSSHPLRDLRDAYRGEKKNIKICREN